MSSPRARPNIAGSWSSNVLIVGDKPAVEVRQTGAIRSSVIAAVGASIALHALALGVLLVRPGAPVPSDTPPIEIELIQQSAQLRGAPPPAAEPAPEALPTPAVAATPPAPQLPAAAQGSSPAATAPPSTPAVPASRQPPASRAAPEVNLGNAAQDLDALSVTGDNVVPPRLDARYRNLPPHYPAAAAQVGAEGTVQLLAHVAPSGVAISVVIVGSSGNAILDDEAKRAVLLWRFQPARAGGKAVSYDYPFSIHFALDDR